VTDRHFFREQQLHHPRREIVEKREEKEREGRKDSGRRTVPGSPYAK